MQTIQYTIPNINCSHCVHTIKSELADLPGVKSVDTDLANKQILVSYDPPVTPAQIESLLAEINYPAQKNS